MHSDIQTQIERRRQSAREEIVRVANKGNHPVFSMFEVKSASGQSYRVDIQSLDELQNTCTCPDYQTNLIGTCKHIEAVLLHLRREYGDRLAVMSRRRPRGTRIYLHYGLEVTVRIGLPLPAQSPLADLLSRAFDPSGVLVGSPVDSMPAREALGWRLSSRLTLYRQGEPGAVVPSPRFAGTGTPRCLRWLSSGAPSL